MYYRLVNSITYGYLKLFKPSRFSAWLYYSLWDSSFRREMSAVYAGKREQIINKHSINAARYTLRRNIHRMEKGLIMKQRREVFGLDYIGETISCFEKVYPIDKKNAVRSDETKWFVDVLTQYFGAIKLCDKTRPLKAIFDRCTEGYAAGEDSSVPYPRSKSAPLPFGYDELYQLFLRRRSVRWFEQKPVPRDLIDKAVTAAIQAPSACNRQPFYFSVIDNPEELKAITRIPMGTTGYGDNIPMMIAIVGQLNAYFDERDRHVIYVDGSLAAMSFMLALETLGLASCPINWPDIEAKERQMEKALKLDKWERPIMLIAVGYPDPEGGVPFSQKAPIDSLRRFN